MEPKELSVEIYDKLQQVTYSLYSLKLSNKIFRALENDIINFKITFGTEFETKINKESKHEIVKIIKESTFTTRRFFLNSQFTESEYRLLGDEIMKTGGFWQVDFGSMVIINLPNDSNIDIDEIFRIFNFNPVEITE